MNLAISTRGKYKKHELELKKTIILTGDVNLAKSYGVPRTTAIYWIRNYKTPAKLYNSTELMLDRRIKHLEEKLNVEKIKIKFLSSIGKYLTIISDSKRKVRKSVKEIILNKIKEMTKFFHLNEILSLIKMGQTRYYRWLSEMSHCERTKNGECGARKVNQLTAKEIMKICNLASSKKYLHFSLTSLWKFAQRNNLILCSLDTWFKYIRSYNLGRTRESAKKKKYGHGIRVTAPNMVWHIDITEYQLENGEKVYLQAIIDNYSRYIIDWNVSRNKSSVNTTLLLKSASNKMGHPGVSLFMDQGGENKNMNVSKLLLGKNIKRFFAKVDIKYSNSMIEAFFKSLKNNFLYTRKIQTVEQFIRNVSFYVKEHNLTMPHSAFQFQTPKEIHHNSWTNTMSKSIQVNKEAAMVERKKINNSFINCTRCLLNSKQM